MTPDALVHLDQMEESGFPSGTRWVVALQIVAAAAATDADADADDVAAAAAAAADGADVADADADADDDAVAADAADGADAVAADADAARVHKFLTEDQPMREGMTMVTVPGRYGYSVTLVGHVRHIRGFEYEMGAGHVSVVRTSGMRTLGQLAAEGPKDDHHCTKSESGEDLHEFRVRRVKEVDVAAWSKVVGKRPKEWDK